MKRILAGDLFCGAGGTSTGLAQACSELGLDLDLLAVNHWEIAIETHGSNHPEARHLCANLEAVDPREVVPGGRLQLLVASPECTHHSSARGGRPVNDQKRASGWHILRWAELLYIDSILIENVPEFRSWGPIGADGHPLKSRRGETYRAFLGALESLGYRVEDRILNAADYGDPTSRRRLFIMARRGNRAITWPEPTHARRPGLLGEAPWRPAREVIDWTVPGRSIFGRKKPLAPATMRRIIEGLERFGGSQLEPFLIQLRGTGGARSLREPMPALTAGGNHQGLVQPFVLQQQSGGVARSTEDPLPTVASAGAISLVQPFVCHVTHGGRPRSVGDPLPTITGAHRGDIGVVEPFLVPFKGEREGQEPRTHSLDSPVPTVTATGPNFGLIEPFLVRFSGDGDGRRPKVNPIEEPIPTVTACGVGFGLARPFMTRYNGTGGPIPVDEPIPTITAKDRYALVQPTVDGVVLDVTFRMLQPHELAAAMSFPPDYQFAGTREDQVRQIGNAVPVNLAKALCKSLIAEHAATPRRKRGAA